MTSNSAGFDPNADDVFGRIAEKYDRLCDFFSFGIHRYWKRTMAAAIAREVDGTMILDIASGTGDIALRLADRVDGSRCRIIASDISPSMLRLAEEKAAARNIGKGRMDFAILDAHDLAAVSDNSIDIYAVSFAMKICDRDQLLPEALRVLKPGGRFYCLEASEIPLRPLHWAYLKYMDWCLPIIASAATGGDRSAYNYLLRGVHEMPNQNAFRAELEENGFEAVSIKNLSLGIVALHAGRKPL